MALGAGILLLAGCGPSLESGTVIGHEYDDADSWTQMSCAGYNQQGFCTVHVPIQHHSPERWLLKIEEEVNGETVRDTLSVPREHWETCREGRRYPDCTQPGQN